MMGNLTGSRRCFQAEITAYLGLIFILLVSFLGALMESASVQMAKNYRRTDVDRAIECVFAEYQKELFEEYGIFALDASYETGQYAEENLADRLAFYGAGNMTHNITRIQFLTDKGCEAFYEQVEAYMESRYGVDIVEDMLGETSLWGQQEEKSESFIVEEETKEKELEEILSENESQLPKEGNPIEHVGQLKRSPILDLVMPKDREISQKRIDGATMLASRNRNEGYGDFSDMEEENSTLSTLFFGEYLLQKFSDFTKIEEGGALDYELEYILAGADSDRENLEAVVHKMMMLRFVPNYLYIQTDGEMKAEAEAMALTLCTLLAVPAVTEAAAQVILLAWSYGETVMDLRSLLKGNRVPVVKSKESWQLQLASLLTLGTKEDKAECMDAERGLPYEEYLRILLFLEEKETAALRALGMIEQNIKTVYGQAFFHADDCVSRMEVESVCKLRRGIHYDFMTYYGYQ